MGVESIASPLFSVDEVEKIQHQKIVGLVGHVFQLTYAAVFDILIHKEKVKIVGKNVGKKVRKKVRERVGK